MENTEDGFRPGGVIRDGYFYCGCVTNAYIPYISNVDFNNEKMTNVPIDDPIRTLTVKLAGYKHDLIKVKEGYNKQVINYDEYQKFSLNLERKIASYEQALKILKQW